MANRAFQPESFTLIKKRVELYAAVLVSELGAVSLRTWNYPVFGVGPNARTYTAAPTTAAGQGYPSMYQTGAEGVRSVTRTATGLWTVKLQDNYQRVLRVDAQGQLAGGLSAIVGCGINSTLLDMNATNGSEIGIALLSATATAADPAAGTTMLLTIILQDATEP